MLRNILFLLILLVTGYTLKEKEKRGIPKLKTRGLWVGWGVFIRNNSMIQSKYSITERLIFWKPLSCY
ncbi:hypothetical protein YC2023_011520 [Brassica napus]